MSGAGAILCHCNLCVGPWIVPSGITIDGTATRINEFDYRYLRGSLHGVAPTAVGGLFEGLDGGVRWARHDLTTYGDPMPSGFRCHWILQLPRWRFYPPNSGMFWGTQAALLCWTQTVGGGGAACLFWAISDDTAYPYNFTNNIVAGDYIPEFLFLSGGILIGIGESQIRGSGGTAQVIECGTCTNCTSLPSSYTLNYRCCPLSPATGDSGTLSTVVMTRTTGCTYVSADGYATLVGTSSGGTTGWTLTLKRGLFGMSSPSSDAVIYTTGCTPAAAIAGEWTRTFLDAALPAVCDLKDFWID